MAAQFDSDVLQLLLELPLKLTRKDALRLAGLLYEEAMDMSTLEMADVADLVEVGMPAPVGAAIINAVQTGGGDSGGFSSSAAVPAPAPAPPPQQQQQQQQQQQSAPSSMAGLQTVLDSADRAAAAAAHPSHRAAWRERARDAMARDGWPQILPCFPALLDSDNPEDGLGRLRDHIAGRLRAAVAAEDFLLAAVLQQQAAEVSLLGTNPRLLAQRRAASTPRRRPRRMRRWW